MRSFAMPPPLEQPTTEPRAWPLLKRLLPALWPPEASLRTRVVVAVLLVLAGKGAVVATPLLLKAAVDALDAATQATEERATLMVLGLVVAYGAVRLAQALATNLRMAVFARVGTETVRRLGRTAFAKLTALDLAYHLDRRTGALGRILDRGAWATDSVIRIVLFQIVPTILEVTLVCVTLWLTLDVRFAVVVLVALLVYAGFTFRITEWRIKQRRDFNDSDNETASRAVDALLNYETVKAFTAEAHEINRYDAALARLGKATERNTVSLAILNMGQAAIVGVALTVAMVMAGADVLDGTLSVGSFVMVNAFVLQLSGPLDILGFVYREIRQSLVDLEQLFGIIDRPPAVADAPEAKPLTLARAEVAFEVVGFHYRSDRVVLQDLSFTIMPGRSVALVGASGSGKTTAARLLCRFYDVTGGAIRIDGQDVRAVSLDSLRRAIGVVPQDTALFNDTLGYNIGYGSPDADEAALWRAAEAAQIDGFIRSLPEGLNTAVGERGLKLSGGERQRVAIARTVLKNPPILILDEATSALDTVTEQSIQAALRTLSKSRTTLMIAHRLSTVVEADEIIVLEQGRVAERGTHAALLAAGGAYADLWARQESEHHDR